MKKSLLTLLLAAAAVLPVAAQDTLRLPTTPPVTYYPKTVAWMADDPMASHLAIAKLTQSSGVIQVYGYPLKSPLRIVGLAGIFDTVYGERPMDCRVPEYMCLYQPGPDTMELKKMVCWTETQPVCRVLFRCHNYRLNTFGWDAPNMYEVYFDDTVTVQDSFYIGCTFFNDHRMEGAMTGAYGMTSGGIYEEPARFRLMTTTSHLYNPLSDSDSIWDYQGEGYYQWFVFPIIDTTGMFADTTIVDTTIVDTTSISPVADMYTHLMPNPATDQATVYSSFPMRSVAIYDPTGRRVLHRRVDDRTLQLDLTGYAKGTYLVVILTPAGRTVKRLVVQ